MDYPLAKEQATLALLVQEGRRALEALKAEEENYLAQRELDATKRITDALVASQEALKATAEYAEVFHVMNKEAERILAELKTAKEETQKAKAELKRSTKEAREALDAKTKELERFAHEVNLQRLSLEGEIAEQKMRKEIIKSEQAKLDDKRNMLGITIKVLKDKGLWGKQYGTEIE